MMSHGLSIQLTSRDLARFMARFSVGAVPAHAPELGPCWIWSGARNRKGYGTFSAAGSTRIAHRVAWVIAHGPIEAGLCVCHRCDNPACVRSDHLFLGTVEQNNADRDAKGRHRALLGDLNGARRRPETRSRGAAHYKSKLSDADVALIRASTEPAPVVAARFGITGNSVRAIRTRRVWKHVA